VFLFFKQRLTTFAQVGLELTIPLPALPQEKLDYSIRMKFYTGLLGITHVAVIADCDFTGRILVFTQSSHMHRPHLLNRILCLLVNCIVILRIIIASHILYILSSFMCHFITATSWRGFIWQDETEAREVNFFKFTQLARGGIPVQVCVFPTTSALFHFKVLFTFAG
jgi:hypothetical protein